MPIDQQKRLAARTAILGHADALDCTVYRPDEHDPEAEELDLGDARILFSGPFVAPAQWDDEARRDFFDGSDPDSFASAYIECEARPATAPFFSAEPGDYVAVMAADGTVQMYYVHDAVEREEGRDCVLIRDDEWV